MVTIYISYHKQAPLLRNEVLVPIRVGKALDASGVNSAETWDAAMLRDDSGDNISMRNPYYCELTAQYWAWKNDAQADYIGHMHYRRHLNFRLDRNYLTDQYGLIEDDCGDADDYLLKYGLDPENVKQVVAAYDIVVAERWDVTLVGSKDNYHHYRDSDSKLFIKDYDRAIAILLAKYPQYAEAVCKYNHSRWGYYTNIFIMRREVYNSYCCWLFDILFALEDELDISQYNTQEARVFGYLSEWLLGIFITYQIMLGELKIGELQRSIWVKRESGETKLPAMNICFAADDGYVQHLGVALESILCNASPEDRFNFYIIDGGISARHRRKLTDIVQKRSKYVKSLCFLRPDMSRFVNCRVATGTHFTIATYYRLTLTSLLPEVGKLLYLDCDLVANASLGELYRTDVSNYYFAGVIDILYQENCKRLVLSQYCNAGVMLINLNLWRRDGMERRFFNYIASHQQQIVWNDQDVLNVVLQDKILYISKRYNAQSNQYPAAYISGFNLEARNAVIVHFIGDKKPWHYDNRTPLRRLYFIHLKQTGWRSFYYKWVICRCMDQYLSKILSLRRRDRHMVLTLLGIKLMCRCKVGR